MATARVNRVFLDRLLETGCEEDGGGRSDRTGRWGLGCGRSSIPPLAA